MTEKIQETEIKKTRLRLSERLKLVASFVPEGQPDRRYRYRSWICAYLSGRNWKN